MLRRVVIPARDLKEQDGMTFMHVSSVSTYMIALCCSGPQHGRRPLSKTNVVEQLTALRNAKTVTNKRVQEELQAFKTTDAKENRKLQSGPLLKRKFDTSRKEIEVDTIQSPTLGDAHGIEMKILKMPYRKNAPLYVELDPENIAYLRNACQWQIEHGDFRC